MSLLLGRFVFGVLLPLVAIFVAVLAFSAVRRRSAPAASEERIATLEEQVRGLLYRVWTLEQTASAPPRGHSEIVLRLDQPLSAAVEQLERSMLEHTLKASDWHGLTWIRCVWP